MPFRLLSCVTFAAAVALLIPAPPAVAQADEGLKKITILTHDDVSLAGVLHKSKKGTSDSPVVILLHGPGDDPNKGGMRELANVLAEKGFNALRFDFRGHGQSTLISNVGKFWEDPINATYMKAAAAKRKPKLELADFKTRTGYWPRLADDIMAARVTLDGMNDNGELSTISTYLIGAKDATAFGFLYLTAEWSRPRTMPGFLNQLPPLVPGGLNRGDASAGLDVAGAVWLSPDRHASVPASALQKWVQYAPDMRERTPMLFLHGATDAEGKRQAAFYKNEVLAAKVPGTTLPNLPLTQIRAIEKTSLRGADLLGKKLGTEDLIVAYLENLEKERRNLPAIRTRRYIAPPAINLPFYGVAKIQ